MISIVMPAYNAMPYLEKTLNSLSKQTIQDFELLFFDDCSSDGTRACIEKYIDKFSIIYTRAEKHTGPAMLRNEGIKRAHGEKIIFLDSDDYFEPEYLESMLNAFDNNDVPIVMAQYDSFGEEDEFDTSCWIYIEDAFLKRAKKIPFSFRDIPFYFEHWVNVPWNKMFKTDFLKEEGIYFQDIPCSNDVYFSHMAMIKGKAIHISSDKPMVHYRANYKGSISDKHDFFSEIEAYKKILENIDETEDELRNRIYESFLIGIMTCIRRGRGDLHQHFFEFVRDEILKKNQLVPREYITLNHPWLMEVFGQYSYGSEIFKVNYVFLLVCKRGYRHLKNLLDICRKNQTVGVLGINSEIWYLEKEFGPLNISWSEEKDWWRDKPKIILCLNALQLPQIYRSIADLRLDHVQIIPLYSINDGAYNE